MDAAEPVERDEEIVDAVVEVFSRWRDLHFAERRELLAAYRAEIVVETRGKPKHRWLRVDRLRLAVSPSHLWLYK